jgi:hypothetical protein
MPFLEMTMNERIEEELKDIKKSDTKVNIQTYILEFY